MGVVTWTQILAAIGVSIGSMVVGFSNGYTSTALVSMTDREKTSFDVSREAESWIGGIMPLAALAGGITGGPLIELLGRRTTLLAIGLPFIGAWLLIALAVNIRMILVGRSFIGYCMGISSLAFPIYLAETLHPEVRGTLGLFPTLFGNGGLLLSYAAGAFLEWSPLAFLGATIPVPFIILMVIATETPRWYVTHEKEEKARKALTWLRGKDVDIEPELKELQAMQTEAAAESEGDTLCRRIYMKPLMIGLGLMFFQQLSGINAVIFYTVSIFQDAGSSVDSHLSTVIVGFVNLLATLAATLLVDRLGRKVLLYISDVAMIITLAVLGVFFFCKSRDMDMSSVGWLPLLCLVLYVIGFSMGFGPIPWLMMGEILPVKVRGPAASVVTGFNWFGAFVVTKSFQNIVDLIGSHGAFWLFCAICVLGLFFVIFFVPETRHVSLEDIERMMTGRSVDKEK